MPMSRVSQLSRRRFGAGLFTATAAAGLAGAATTGLTPTSAVARPAGGVLAVPPVASYRIGKFTVTVLSDGFFDIPYGAFAGAEPATVESAAAAVFAPGEGGVRIGFSVWLIDDGERLILVDSGPAGLIPGSTGRLPAALAAVGVDPADIDAIVVTHMHFDHISGLVASDRRVFPNATVHIDRRDVDYFTDPAVRTTAPDLLESSFAAADKVVALYPDLERLDAVERDLVPGISTVDLNGHTPGHIGLRIADAGQSLIISGDMLFHPAVHPARSDVGVAFDPDAAAAQSMRERFYPRAIEEQALLAATHMPFPGLGRIVVDSGERHWLPADWAYAE